MAIAVIAILASVLIPAMSGSRTRTLSAVSASNMRQSANYLMLYAVENGNVLELKAGGSGGADKLWPVIVAAMIAPDSSRFITSRQQRIASLDIMYCPLFTPYRHDPAASNWSWTTYGLFAIARGDYARRETIEDTGGSRYSVYTINLQGDVDASSHPLLMDSVQVSLDPPIQRMAITTLNSGESVVSPHMRHNGHARAVFLDGSVRDLGKEELRKIGFNGAIDANLGVVSLRES